MRVYAIRRLLQVPPMLLAITIVAFMAGRFVPDYSGRMMVLAQTDLVPAEILAQIRHNLGLDQPFWVYYARWLGVMKQEDGRFSGVLEGDLGQSLWGGETYR